MTHAPDEPVGDADVASNGRRRWMSVLARASLEELESAWAMLPDRPAHQWLRRPETGLAMLRGRAGGSGERFNLGEASVTRCTVRTKPGMTGVAYILGRDARRAELAALFDALLQEGSASSGAAAGFIDTLAAAQAGGRDEAARKAAATRVDFYTLARGDTA